MWFKQVQIFRLQDASQFLNNDLAENLGLLAFQPCFPSMPSSIGWVSPLEDDSENPPLLRILNGYIMLCLQVEEKILPSTVVRQELANKVKQIELQEDRKIRHKEKLSLKDEITLTLLPRAFSKLTKIYGYIDTKNQWLVLGTSSPKKAEQFISLFKKTATENLLSLDIHKPAPIMTSWLKNQNYPTSFAIEKACMLQDPEQQNRVIRCRHQDLFANGIQALIKDGCEAKQLALSWQDRVKFVLADDFSLQSIKFEEEILSQVKEMEPETRQQVFDADFYIMTEVFSALLNELMPLFAKSDKKIEKSTMMTEAEVEAEVA